MTQRAASSGGDPPTNMFEGFEVTRVLSSYDRPTLFIAEGKEGQPWLFSWRKGGELGMPDAQGKEQPEIWVAFQLSKRRLKQILRGHVSLREAILLSSDDRVSPLSDGEKRPRAYILQGDDPLHPQRTSSVDSTSIPAQLLPLKDLSVFGKPTPNSTFTKSKRNWQVGLHFIEGAKAEGTPSLAVASPFQECAQRILTYAAHHALQPVTTGQVEAREHILSPEDWSGIIEPRLSPGTLSLRGRSRTTRPEEVQALNDSCEALAKVMSVEPANIDFADLYTTLGPEAMMAFRTLLQQLSFIGISLNLSWRPPSGVERSVIVDGHRAGEILEHLDALGRRLRHRSELSPVTKENDTFVTVSLSAAEASMLKEKEINGSGGLQDLLRELKEQFSSDNQIRIYPDQVGRVVRYVQDYGSGGFQDRLRPVYWALHRLGFAFSGLR